jgi:hypothetical protein
MTHLILLVLAILAFFVGAILAFRWFGTSNPEDALGYISLGLIAFAAQNGRNYVHESPHRIRR